MQVCTPSASADGIFGVGAGNFRLVQCVHLRRLQIGSPSVSVQTDLLSATVLTGSILALVQTGSLSASVWGCFCASITTYRSPSCTFRGPQRLGDDRYYSGYVSDSISSRDLGFL